MQNWPRIKTCVPMDIWDAEDEYQDRRNVSRDIDHLLELVGWPAVRAFQAQRTKKKLLSAPEEVETSSFDLELDKKVRELMQQPPRQPQRHVRAPRVDLSDPNLDLGSGLLLGFVAHCEKCLRHMDSGEEAIIRNEKGVRQIWHSKCWDDFLQDNFDPQHSRRA